METMRRGFSCYPSCSDADDSVLALYAYNHHYYSWLAGSGAEACDLGADERTARACVPNPNGTSFRRCRGSPAHHDDEDEGEGGFEEEETEIPDSIVFKENESGGRILQVVPRLPLGVRAIGPLP